MFEKFLKFLFGYDEDSLKSKLLFYFTIYYFPLVLFLIILSIIFLSIFHDFNSEIIFKLILIDIVLVIFIYLLSRKVFSLVIEKLIISRLNLIRKDFELIKFSNKLKKLNITGTDEIDKLMFKTNEIFGNLNKLLIIEKECSLVDPLTSAYNRRALENDFKKLIGRINRNNETISLLLFDLDDFKKINDSYGHDIGDEVLINIVKILNKVIRKYDSIYRIGGEEFVVLFSNLNVEYRKEILYRIKYEITENIRKLIPVIKKDVTISGGFVNSNYFHSKDENLLIKMLKIADKNLYKAKRSGKNKIIESKFS